MSIRYLRNWKLEFRIYILWIQSVENDYMNFGMNFRMYSLECIVYNVFDLYMFGLYFGYQSVNEILECMIL